MENTATKKESIDVHSILTERVIHFLMRGIIPWKVNWTRTGLPQNLLSKKPYRGINVFLIAALGYEKNFFLTQKQADEIGAMIKEGQEGFPVFYWKWPEKSSESNGVKVTEFDKSQAPQLGYYRVFNIAQCEEIKKSMIPKIERPERPFEICTGIVGNMPNLPDIQNSDHEASYVNTLDFIDMKEKERFPNDEAYFLTLFNLLIHSTGHESRLNRKEVMKATLTDLAMHSTEELIAEMGATYLASFAGLQSNEEVSSQYLEGWIKKFEKDKRVLMYAGNHTQKAVDFILYREFRKESSSAE